MPPEVTDSESPETFADLMAEHRPRLAASIRSLAASERASKDVLLETNVTLLKKLRDFCLGTNFTAWSLQIAYFEVLTWRRKWGREKVFFDSHLVESLAERVEEVAGDDDERLAALSQSIEKFPERQREVIERRYLKSEQVQDIAKAKRAIYLFMSGAPSQIDLWDHKPKMVSFVRVRALA